MSTLNELLRARGLSVRCPGCHEEFPVRRAQLFDATGRLPPQAVGYLDQEGIALDQRRADLRQERAQLQRRSFTSAASSGVGQQLEMLGPSLAGLPASPEDCRALLRPIDYIAFSGATRGKVQAIRFIEVKSGNQGLGQMQKAIRAAVEGGRYSLRIADHTLPSD